MQLRADVRAYIDNTLQWLLGLLYAHSLVPELPFLRNVSFKPF